jgi:hypothetical protein
MRLSAKNKRVRVVEARGELIVLGHKAFTRNIKSGGCFWTETVSDCARTITRFASVALAHRKYSRFVENFEL